MLGQLVVGVNWWLELLIWYESRDGEQQFNGQGTSNTH